ncbi:cytochrome b/b6 domain-containing protein [Streptomyces sp. BA2]|uniref:cytochrome b/b6 domain-containing protein n=1 Tax=Streptomyces sp. BA2 TaxID=436595 RepID=UPI001923692A|nr:cytochrome b/b6 domain-containing protein [Streptomyces sp. BA2]
MAGTTSPRPEVASRVRRFTPTQRWVHRATALLMGICVATAACLYVPQLAELVGRRALVVTVHEWSGLLLPAPFLAGLASRAFRGDLRLLNRFGPHDKAWLRRRNPHRLAGKFNAGQKLYAGWLAGAVLVMLGTGLLMWFTDLAPLAWRTGSTFVHDWLALALGLVIAGHVGMAWADPEARRGMRTGSVDPGWAERRHPLWLSARPAFEDELGGAGDRPSQEPGGAGRFGKGRDRGKGPRPDPS